MGKLKTTAIAAVSVMTMLAVSCGKAVEWKFSEKIARVIRPDGWVYSFKYQYMKSGEISDTQVPYSFSGINLRYRFPKDQAVQGSQPIQMLSNDDAVCLNDYLRGARKKAPDELAADALDTLTFSELDKDMVIRLKNQALSAETHREGKYPDLPSYAMLNEQYFLDGYEFQIGFLSSVGCVDVIYIDVLYEQSSAAGGYVQLSDLVENDTASDAQKQAMQNLNDISAGIVRDNDLLYGKAQYSLNEGGELDYSRLYTFLRNIEHGKISDYILKMQ